MAQLDLWERGGEGWGGGKEGRGEGEREERGCGGKCCVEHAQCAPAPPPLRPQLCTFSTREADSSPGRVICIPLPKFLGKEREIESDPGGRGLGTDPRDRGTSSPAGTEDPPATCAPRASLGSGSAGRPSVGCAAPAPRGGESRGARAGPGLGSPRCPPRASVPLPQARSCREPGAEAASSRAASGLCSSSISPALKTVLLSSRWVIV